MLGIGENLAVVTVVLILILVPAMDILEVCNPAGDQLDRTDQYLKDYGPSYRLVSYLLLAGVSIVSPLSPATWNLDIVLILVFLGWQLLLAPTANLPGRSIERVCAQALIVLVALAVSQHQSSPVPMLVVTGVCLFLVGMGLYRALVSKTRPMMRRERFTGGIHASRFATYCAILTFGCLYFYEIRWIPWYCLLFAVGVLGFLILLTRTLSVTWILCTVVGLWALRPVWNPMILAICGALLVGLGAYLILSRSHPWLLLGRTYKIDSFNGRQPLWRILLVEARSRPLFGHGFFWTTEAIRKHSRWGAKNAHNAYLEHLLSGGMITLILFAAIVLRALWDADLQGQGSSAWFFFLLFWILHGCFWSGIALPHFIGLVFWISLLSHG